MKFWKRVSDDPVPPTIVGADAQRVLSAIERLTEQQAKFALGMFATTSGLRVSAVMKVLDVVKMARPTDDLPSVLQGDGS